MAWRRGAEAGVRTGAELANISTGIVEICSIVGTTVDMIEGSVAGAAALALWDAVGLSAPPGARARLDEVVLERPYPFA